jgi:hypothetical protein
MYGKYLREPLIIRKLYPNSRGPLLHIAVRGLPMAMGFVEAGLLLHVEVLGLIVLHHKEYY